MKKEPKAETITFKVDPDLAEAMRSIPNRSAFIRKALIQALERLCPLCGGSGLLNAEELRHWERFARNHHVSECTSCHAHHLVCLNAAGASKSC